MTQASFHTHSRHCPANDVLRSRLYDRAMLIVQRPQGWDRVLGALGQGIEATFGAEPTQAHKTLAPDDFKAKADALRADMRRDEGLRDMAARVLTDMGFCPEETAMDAIILRIQPPATYHISATLKAHRDSWGSGLMSQINLWAPVFPVDRDRTVGVYPALWDTPVSNTAEGWDWKNLKHLDAGAKKDENNLLPVVTETPDAHLLMPVVPDAGDMFLFSAAHLHASIPNTSDHIRFSVETRLIHLEDERAGRGAPVIDGAPARTGLAWFSRLGDGEKAGNILKGEAIRGQKGAC